MADQLSNSKLSLPPISLHLLSGALSGLASCVLLQPFDLLKTRLQQAHINSPLPSTLSIYRVSSDVISRDGVLGLWRGTSPTIIRNVPGIAAYFFGLSQLRTSMSSLSIFTQKHSPLDLPNQAPNHNILPTLTPTGDFFAGVLARTSVGFVLMPITVVKTRFESNLYDYRSIRGAFQEIVTTQGPKGLWRGFIPTVLRDAPFAGVFISAYEATKRLLLEPGQQYPILLHTVPATAAAIIATLITAPFDLIKTDLQLRHSNNTSISMAIKLILNGRFSNSKILFKGSGLRLLRKSLSSAIGWTLYEGLIKRWATKN